MPTTLYVSGFILARLFEAQETLDRHVLSFAGGCRACGTATHCPWHLEAAAVFARYGALPMRRPGASGWGGT